MKRMLPLCCAALILSAIPGGPVRAESGGDRPAAATAALPAEPPVVSEVRAGILLHDRGLFHSRHERDEDASVEVLFRPLRGKLFEALRSPRPHVGASVNDEGYTSQLYGGFTWEWRPSRDVFVDGTLGLSVHDGKLETSAPRRSSLGTRVLFRESLEVGYRFYGRHGVSFLVEHASNGGLARDNDGLTSMGLRYGFRF